MTDTDTVKTVVSHSRPAAPRHSLFEDIVAIAIASYVVSLGLYFLHEANTVTGGTAGVALVVSALTGAPFGLMLLVVNVPFYALAVWKKGVAFTTRTIIAVTIVSALSSLHPAMIGHLSVAVPYATVTGSILLGLGLLMLFRHAASLGGFNVIALLAQERLGWRAGNVQLAMDAVVVLCAFTFADLWTVLWSAVGVAVLNLILTMNHRPGRYMDM